MSERILNASEFFESNSPRLINGEIIYPNNYEHSRIRAYLNGLSYTGKENEQIEEFLDNGILQSAFNSAAQALILPKDNDHLNDKLFLSYDELLLPEIEIQLDNMSDEELRLVGWDRNTLTELIQQYRKRKASDYAMANAVWLDYNNNNNGMWWTMIPEEINNLVNNNGVKYVSSNGEIYSMNADYNVIGVVPALIISDSAILDW